MPFSPGRGGRLRIEELPLSTRSKQVLAEAGYRDLFPPQAEAVRRGLLAGKSLVVASPTGSGKSLVALLAAVKRLDEGLRSIYVAPLKSLVYEQAARWRRVLEPLGARVAVATGDYDRVEPWLEESDVLLITYEKFDSLMRHGADWLYQAGLLVVDEVHYVSEPKRGPVLESAMARWLAYSGPAQVLAMSATVPNAADIARWLGAELVVSDWRPVKLREGVYYSGSIHWGDGSVERIERATRHETLDVALDSVARGGQVLVFTQSRRKAVELAERLASTTEAGKAPRLRGSGEEELRPLLERSEHRSINALIARLARLGIGFHHAGLASYQRGLVEELFRKGDIKVLFATPTLAAGVNLPARRVVVDSLYRYRGGGRSEAISVAEYKQLAGRAGRPGLDEIGEAVIVARSSEQLWSSLVSYVHGEAEPVSSRLVSEKALRVQVLAVAASARSIYLEELLDVFRRTLYASTVGDPSLFVVSSVDRLAEMGFLERRGELIEVTPLGRRVSELYIDPFTARRMLDGLPGAGRDAYTLLFLSLWNSDSVLLRVPRNRALLYEEEAETVAEQLGFSSLDEYDVALAARALYTADMLVDWIEEVREDEILAKYMLDPGDVRAVVEAAEWLLYAMEQLARLEALPQAEDIAVLRERVRHGVREELLDLVKLPGVGRVRARLLYNAGLQSREDVAKLSPERLAQLLRGLGEARAREAVEAARSRGVGNRGRRRTLLDYMRGGERTASG